MAGQTGSTNNLEEHMDFLLTVLKHTDFSKPRFGDVAQEVGFSNANVAQKKFKNIVEASRRFKLVRDKIVNAPGNGRPVAAPVVSVASAVPAASVPAAASAASVTPALPAVSVAPVLSVVPPATTTTTSTVPDGTAAPTTSLVPAAPVKRARAKRPAPSENESESEPSKMAKAAKKTA